MQPARDLVEIRREELLTRLDVARPKVAKFIAPAGFGKSTLARQWAENRRVALCDAADVAGLAEFARAVVLALADEAPDRIAFLAQCEMVASFGASLHDDGLPLAIQAWRQEGPETIFIFENAERLLRVEGCVRFLSKLLAALPASRRVIVCSREALPLDAGRYVGPERSLTLRADDLRFTAAEFRRVLASPEIDDETIAQALKVSCGWPIVTALFARFLNAGRLRELLPRLDAVAFEELYEYVVGEALASLDPFVASALEVAAFVPNPAPDDVAHALGAEFVDPLNDFAANSPFVKLREGRYELHPLVATALRRKNEARGIALLQRAAAATFDDGNAQRAAELYLAAGDRLSAARSLDSLTMLEMQASVELAHLIAGLDRETIMQFPQLWGFRIGLSRFAVDPVAAVGEAKTILARLSGVESLAKRGGVIRPLASYLSRLGMHDEGYRLIRDLERESAIPTAPRTMDEAAVLYIRMMIEGRLGLLRASEETGARAWPIAGQVVVTATLWLIEQAAEVYRASGRRGDERRALDEAIERAHGTTYTTNEGLALAEASFGAWLAGEDALHQRYLTALERCIEEHGVRGLSYFAAAARGYAALNPQGIELPKWIACAHLMLAAGCGDVSEAIRHATAAHEAAVKFAAPFTLTLASIALAELVPNLRSERLAKAAESAARVESPRLHAAVDALVAGERDCGMLQPFVERFRAGRGQVPSSCTVSVLAGSVLTPAGDRNVSERRLELLLALARSRRPVPRGELVELLWPDASEAAAVNAFNLCVHQLRKALGERTILHGADGYRLGDHVRVDLWEMEDYVGTLGLRRQLSASQRAILTHFFDRLSAPLPSRYSEWSWFDRTERRIGELRCSIAQRLAEEALDGGDPETALRLARKILAYDPCDEPAREIAVRAYLAAGREAEAFREYRQYRDLLKAELDAAPSISLSELLDASRVPA